MWFFYVIGFLALADILWGWRAARALPRRWMRITGVAWAALQLTGLLTLIFIARLWPEIPEALWRPVHSCVLVWHLLFIPAWFLLPVVRAILALARKIARVQRREAPPADGRALTRREFFGTTAALTPPLLTLGAAVAGESQLEDFRVRKLDVHIANLPPALDGFTIAHITDLHVGRFTRGRVLEHIVEETNRLDAGLVAVTGDIINQSMRDFPAARELLRALRGSAGVAVCEGNHDLMDDARAFYRECERGGIPLLRGDAAEIIVRGQRVQILGLPWARGDAAHREAVRVMLAKRDPSAWPLLLAHHPHAWDYAEGIPLTLAGHTHGGQLMFTPTSGFGPWFFRYWSGIYAREGRSLVVSNGTGNWFPIRIGAPAEILHLTLRSAPASV